MEANAYAVYDFEKRMYITEDGYTSSLISAKFHPTRYQALKYVEDNNIVAELVPANIKDLRS